MWARSSNRISIPNDLIRSIKLSLTEYKLVSKSELLELQKNGITVYNYLTTVKYKREVNKDLETY